jgi:hypothetical protein
VIALPSRRDGSSERHLPSWSPFGGTVSKVGSPGDRVSPPIGARFAPFQKHVALKEVTFDRQASARQGVDRRERADQELGGGSGGEPVDGIGEILVRAASWRLATVQSASSAPTARGGQASSSCVIAPVGRSPTLISRNAL